MIIEKIYKQISAVLIMALLVAGIALVPLTPHGQVNKAHALFGGGDTVFVVGGTGTIQETLSAAFNKISALANLSVKIKELSLDPIAWAISKMIVKSMTESIVRWINGGFNGSPAFVADLKQYLLQQADIAAGNYIYNDPSLNFLCSPFALNVKIALATAYQDETQNGMNTQCTLSDATNNVSNFLNGNFSNGGWPAWFQVTQNPQNTPTGAYLASKVELDNRVAQAQNQSKQELNWGNGFLSYKACVNVTANGKTTPHCTVQTPGKVIQAQLDKALGAGQDTLVTADEINEIIGALFAQLAQHVLTGVGGLLGAGGNSSYSNTYSSNGSSYGSYLDAMQAQGTGQTGVGDPIADGIQTEQEYISANQQVITAVNNLEAQVAASASSSACSGVYQAVTVPQDLLDHRSAARAKVTAAQNTISVLQVLDTQYQAATDPNIQLQYVNTFQQNYEASTTNDQADMAQLQIYIQYTMQDEITSTQQAIASACAQSASKGQR